MSGLRGPAERRALGSVRGRILSWYRTHKRDLPWRRTRDPYAIWVSEIMLQQTRVDTVLPFYERFLLRFPDVKSLARARDSQVLAAWSGLGYYRRARNLHAAGRFSRERVGVAGSGFRHLAIVVDGDVGPVGRGVTGLQAAGQIVVAVVGMLGLPRQPAAVDVGAGVHRCHVRRTDRNNLAGTVGQ